MTQAATNFPRDLDTLHTPRVAVVIPCYRVTDHIESVLARIPASISHVICVDDGCPDASGDFIEARNGDSRVKVARNATNLGVGGAMVTGYRAALAANADIVVKLDGDGQMDPALIPMMIAPICRGEADYAKGNRFHHLEGVARMPAVRLLGNAVLSFVSKFSTGYWQTFDPNNGYTAIHAAVLGQIALDKIDRGYFFESDMLFRLNILRAVVQDVPMTALYGDESSHVNIPKETFGFLIKHLTNFGKRIFYNYFLRGFGVASIQWVLGPLMLLFGISFGISEWIKSAAAGVQATSGTVMLASLPTIIGMQFLLAAIDFDVKFAPTSPLHRLLR